MAIPSTSWNMDIVKQISATRQQVNLVCTARKSVPGDVACLDRLEVFHFLLACTLVCLLLAMNALLVITICCFFALFVTALVVASHVRVVRADPDEEHDLSRRPNLQLRRRDPGEPPSPYRREQSLRRLVEMKEPDWRFLISGRPRRSRSNRAISLGRAKLPQPARPSGPERFDWAFSSKDPGDLNDPYGHPHKQHGLAGADLVSRLARKG